MAAEAFEFAFEKKGRPLPVTGLEPNEGIVLDGETSAWPLGVALQIVPTSPGTQVKWENIQKREGWIGARTFGFQMSARNGRLRFEGIKPGMLPEGSYRASIFVGGYRFHQRMYEFTIPRNDTAIIQAEEKTDKRRVELDRDLNAFDEHTLRIIKASSIDGIGLPEWFRQDKRDARKACVLNILAKLRTPIGGSEPLAEGVTRLIFADVDRVYAELEPRFVDRIMADPDFSEDRVIHSTHQRLLKYVPNGTSRQLHSVRENTPKLSMQLCLALPDDPNQAQYADIDIDLGNPFTTPAGFIIHIGELIDPGKTDHLGLCESLRGTACADFLYYRVVEGESGKASAST